MTYTTDNRWSTGSQRSLVPDDAPAAYGARWIDYDTRADILGDRQGFAYGEWGDAIPLVDFLTAENMHQDMPQVPQDDGPHLLAFDGWRAVLRRSGGYVYVDAWLNPT
jgi:hypothetical protein